MIHARVRTMSCSALSQQQPSCSGCPFRCRSRGPPRVPWPTGMLVVVCGVVESSTQRTSCPINVHHGHTIGRARTKDEEKACRWKTQTFIFESCKMLKARLIVMTTSTAMCQRYFSMVSLRSIDRKVRVRRTSSRVDFLGPPKSAAALTFSTLARHYAALS